MLDIEKIKEDQEGQEGQSALAYRRIPTYMDAAFVQRVKKELDEIWNRGKENKDDSPTIDINSEIFVEINNLSHFNEAYKVRALMKYIVPKHLGGNYLFLRAIHIGKMDGSVYEGMPNTILLFWWEHNNIPNIICYISTSNNTQFSCPFVTNAFHIDISDIDDNDFEDDSYGWYCYLSKEQYLNDIINYSGSDYTPMFRMVGEHITCCNPPLIRHKYRLGSLRIPYNNMSSEYVEKYYDLYHSGNWNAKHAIERGGFNLNG